MLVQQKVVVALVRRAGCLRVRLVSHEGKALVLALVSPGRRVGVDNAAACVAVSQGQRQKGSAQGWRTFEEQGVVVTYLIFSLVEPS